MSFDILNRHSELASRMSIDASAGTGKTFAIENYVVRLLLEKDVDISQILLVTFTRLATREMKERVRNCLRKRAATLDAFLQTQTPAQPDYLAAVCEKGLEAALLAKRKLDTALTCFDEAKISTIHGFCQRILAELSPERMLSLDSLLLTEADLVQLARDFMRTEITPAEFCTQQLQLFAARYQDNADDALRDLALLASTYTRFEEIPSFEQSYAQFQTLKLPYTKISLENAFLGAAIHYKELLTKDKALNPKTKAALASLLDLVDKPSKETFANCLQAGCIAFSAFHPAQLKKNAPDAGALLRQHFAPLYQILEDAGSFDAIRIRLASKLSCFMQKHFNEEGTFCQDELLRAVAKMAATQEFQKHISKNLRAIIVDEFQDTDPCQWQIFSQLPAEFMLLVGDPKQAIYSFRRADVYTYLAASSQMEQKAQLSCNFRSQKDFLQALNAIFAAPGLIHLPKTGSSLAIETIAAPPGKQGLELADGLGSVHFWQAESEEAVLAAITEEIVRLPQNASKAILVKDRLQARRAATYLESRGLPYSNQRAQSLRSAIYYPSFCNLLEALSDPSNVSLFKKLLASPMIGIPYAHVLIQAEKGYSKWQALAQLYTEKGLAVFVENFFYTSWHEGELTLKEVIQARDGTHLWDEVQQLADCAISESLSLRDLQVFFANLPERSEEEKFKLRLRAQEGATRILTTHVSKGLEYDIVFALGIASRSPALEKAAEVEGVYRRLNDPDIRALYTEEKNAEKLRQLYVAFTRAKIRLYVPIFEQTKFDAEKASAVELFLKRLQDANIPLHCPEASLTLSAIC